MKKQRFFTVFSNALDDGRLVFCETDNGTKYIDRAVSRREECCANYYSIVYDDNMINRITYCFNEDSDAPDFELPKDYFDAVMLALWGRI